jgi:hypothetical protein
VPTGATLKIPPLPSPQNLGGEAEIFCRAPSIEEGQKPGSIPSDIAGWREECREKVLACLTVIRHYRKTCSAGLTQKSARAGLATHELKPQRHPALRCTDGLHRETTNMETKYKRQSIGRDKAIALANSGWWEGKTPREIAKFQLFTDELSMPFEVFHEALEKTLGRPVWTHELALNFDGIAMELLGEKDAPTMEEIIGLIPEEKRILVAV